MKAIYAAILMILIVFNPIHGQKLVDSDNTWNIADCSQSGPECWTHRYKFDEDSTLIRGEYYHELLRSQEKSGNNWFTTSDFMREENNQVWYIENKHPKAEILLYDFNLIAGDSFILMNHINFQIKLIVDKIDSVEYGNILRKRISIYSSHNVNYKMTWIEGIGDVGFWLGPKWVDVLDGGEGWLLCHDYKDETIFKVKRHEDCWYTRTSTDDLGSKYKYKIYPNPSTNFLHVENYNDIKSLILYDQYSNPSSTFIKFDNMDVTSLPSGIYFVQIQTLKGKVFYDKFIKL